MKGYRRCNNCGKKGHFGKDYPTLSRAATCPPVQTRHQHQRKDRGNRPQATGRVYAMTGAGAAGSGNLVMGRCMIAGESLYVLYDSGATHSFVSIDCVERLGLPVRELQSKLTVSTPASGLELEVILRMDWLSTNRILIDCREKRLLFPDSEELELVSPQGVVKEIQGGAQCFIIFACMEVGEKEGTSVIPLVHEFEDVLLDEVPGLPPNREVEFSIDLVPGTGPVSMAPYHMALVELVELKKQIEELMDKKFIRPNTSP
ncbi:uncharacterized protein LOC114163555 [Vigna unguiculata]|uniref:uncharacterized protein LOC114163555 n=1 Tax=Vigna unguiculata TaxID=3917 RepID=UPI00101667E7|nr:uncharacterized protein LOC114163555 [Vigna unguiculata]